jgi:mannose-6-phosphate isomerase
MSGTAASGGAAARVEFERLRGWFVGDVLPLWSTVAVDRLRGGFFEGLDRAGRPLEAPRRTRVVGRQLFVFSTAPRLGWTGPWRELVDHGLAWFRRALLDDAGTVISSCDADGRPIAAGFDLYDHAFALFGLAAAYEATGQADLSGIAARMRAAMKAGWGHPIAGFEAARPRRLPLGANPHMHVFEAAEAWAAVAPAAERAGWRALGDEIAGLALARFVDPRSGAIREFYDGDWRPMPGDLGRLVEPGHQFEWAWLLLRWGRSRGVAAAEAAARRLVELAEAHGVDPARGVAFAELWDDLSAKDRATRVWPQTERIKAWAALAEAAATPAARETALAAAAAAARGLAHFVDPTVPGLWHERMRADGSFLDEPAPTSTLYHVACALDVLGATLDGPKRAG